MKLILKNFKCFANAEFEFPNSGNLLISAPSGCGKTSLFEAIRFVLWGCKDTSCIKFDEKKCEVTMELNNVVFRRTKNPNNLTIKISDKLIDNPEEYISKHFAKYPEDFLSLTSQNQMTYLESLYINNTNIEEIKIKIKNTISDGNKTIEKSQYSIDVLKQTLKKLPRYNDNIEEPVSVCDNMSVSECQSKIKNLKEQLIYHQSLVHKKETYESEYKRLVEELKNYHIDDDNLCQEITEINYKINEHRNITNSIKKLTLIENDKEQYEILRGKLDTIRNINLKNNLIQSEINELWRKCVEIEKTDNIKDIQKYIKNSTTIKSKYSCPCCKIPLKLDNDILVSVNKMCADYNVLKNILEKMQLITNIDGNIPQLESTISRLEKSIVNRKERNDLEKKLIQFDNVKDLENRLSYLQTYRDKKSVSNCVRDKIASIGNINFDLIKKLKSDIADLECIIDDLKNYEAKLSVWKHNESIKSLHEEYNYNLCEKEERLKYEMKAFEKINTLKRLVEEAQSKSLTNLLIRINRDIKYYTDKFFTDDILVKFSEYKEVKSTKNTKPQLNIQIYHKNNWVKPQTLSSGEYARVRLAIDLVLYKLSKTNCPLLLDEVTANLDSDISSIIFDTISEKIRCVYVIAHQVIEGIFDNILNL